MGRIHSTAVVVLLCCAVGAFWYPFAGRATAAETAVAESDAAADFARHVYPILRRSCFECHGEEKQEAGLRLDQREAAFDSGMIEPGAPQDSELLRRIGLPRSDDQVMPAIGDPLPQHEVAIIRRWIEQGALWPAELQIQQHWAYVAPQRPAVPDVSNALWAKSALDRFVLRRLDEAGLAPSPPADPSVLVRRLYLDLIGLPPSPAEVDAFLQDPSDAGIERLVDDLLRRPEFGQRWARPWLDLARYADSHGFQRDNLIDLWAYRDWVIDALNADMPFDEFTIQQIAGDLLPNATVSQRIATGFHRCAPTNVEAGSLPEETRVEQIIDRVNTTAAVWLGSTLECAQCHDHKFDPFTAKDYYRLFAFFNSTEREADLSNPKTASSIQFLGPKMPLPDPQRDALRTELQEEQDQWQRRATDRRERLAAELHVWAAKFAETLADAPQTHALEMVQFQSLGSTDSFERLDDGSILLQGGDPPAQDVYTVRARGDLKSVRAFRLDVLTHPSLPGTGPGRGDAVKANFVLNEFTVRSGDGPLLPFHSATADHSQKAWDVGGAVDGEPKSGWAIAPQFGKPHWATFVLAEPLDVTADTELVFQLIQRWGRSRTIGRFRLSAITGNPDAAVVPSEIVAAATADPAKWSKKDRQRLLEYCEQQDPAMTRIARQIDRLDKQLKQLEPDTTLVMVEIDQPRPSHIFMRGDYQQPGESVAPGTPEILHPMPDGPPNRLTLARWLVDPANPLVARVTVNRWWAELFGQGLVTTPEDFGIKGAPPSHPQLLDWLAVELVDGGWSMKRLLKTIVTSATYQQSSRITPQLLAIDDQNQLLSRGPRFRLDAEAIRDNALVVSGLLSLQQSGPPIRPYQPDGVWAKVGGTAYDYAVNPGGQAYRRGIYVVHKRAAPYPSFVNFDATPRLTCTVQRSRTNTPLQALTLLNDPVYTEAAQALAQRVLTEAQADSIEQRIIFAFRLCTARYPTDSERRVLRNLLDARLAAALSDRPETQQTASRPSAAEPSDQIGRTTAAERAAWTDVATVLLNLHETITKE